MPLSLSGDGSVGPLSATEVGYLDGVTSAVQTQIDSKLTTPGAWTAYTPTWTSAGGSNPTLGNGTLAGRYSQVGKIVHVRILCKIGSTTNIGTGAAYEFTLPVNQSSAFGTLGESLLDAFIWDASLGVVYRALTQVYNNQAWRTRYADNSSLAVAYNQPITFATDDFILISGTYEAA